MCEKDSLPQNTSLPHLQHLEEEPPSAARSRTRNLGRLSLAPEHRSGTRTFRPSRGTRKIPGLALRCARQEM